MKNKMLALAMAGVAAAAVVGVTAVAQQTRPAAAVLNVLAPEKADNFRLVDANSYSHELYYFKNAAAVVLVAWSGDTAHARELLPAVQALKAAYAGKNVKVFLLNSAPGADRQQLQARLKAAGVDVPVLLDDTQLVGESLGVSRVGQALVIQPKTWKVVYSGPVNDRLAGASVRSAAAKTAYLADAVDALLAGKPIAQRNVKIESPALAFPGRDAQSAHANISYSDTVAPILAKNCVACHSEGGIGPFAMTSYEIVKGYAPMIREAVRTDRMPPYNADPHVGAFTGSMNMSSADMQTLVHWIEAGAPRGPAGSPDPLKINAKPAPEWELGTPDYVITLPAFDVPASGVVDYQTPSVQNTLTENRWLRASQVKAGDRRAVHHLLSNGVGGYAVGAETTVYPEGTASLVTAGSKHTFQMHYTPYGKATTDVTRVGLYFYPKDAPPKVIRRSAVVLNAGIQIAPNTARHEEVAYLTFPADATLFTIFPHAHYRGENMHVFLQKPGGQEEMILSLPHYDFNWQRGYDFATPVSIPAGSKLITRYQYDNSADNPSNPDPSITVTWGEQSHEEMQYTALGFRWNDEQVGDEKPEHMQKLNASRMLGMMDSNIDGKVARTELRGRQAQALLANFDRLDADKDGFLQEPELAVISSQMNRRIEAAQQQQSVGQ